jgi:V/A-type H+-transporting ATPase subunit F
LKYFIIGEREMVLAFRLVGVTGAVAETRREVLDSFDRVIGRGGTASVPVDEIPRVLILTENAASLIQNEELEWQKTGQYPLIVEVPGLNGHLTGRRTLTDAIGEAIGVQV